MKDTTTCMEGCSARVIAQLYRFWKQPASQQPFTPVLYQRNYRNATTMPKPRSFLESTEILYPSTSCPWHYSQGKCATLADFMTTCQTSDNVPSDENFMRGFRLYTDGAKEIEELVWDCRSCSQVLQDVQDKYNGVTVTILQHNISLPKAPSLQSGSLVLVDGTDYGDLDGVRLFITDITFNSCWIVDWGLDAKSSMDRIPECMEDAQLGLVELDVANFVDNLKDVWCE